MAYRIPDNATEIFKEKAKKKYGDRYDYSLSEYKGHREKLKIICKEHGVFQQTPEDHIIRNLGCPMCSGRLITTDIWKEKAKSVHGLKYDYSKSVYTGTYKQIKITCPTHGDFLQIAKDHLNGCGCQKCKKEKIGNFKRLTKESFIDKSNKVHNNFYDYSKSEYINNSTKVIITCPIHGDFLQTPLNHMNGEKCPKCSKVYRPTTEEWIKKANEVHNSRYDYSKTEYKNGREKVCIICPKHGEFWQTPESHILNRCGCPKCSMSHMEEKICNLLKKNNIKFLYEDKINGIFKRQSVDFYLPDKNLVIECQGGQHFYPCFDRSNPKKSEEIYINIKNRDIKKNKILSNNSINVLYFTDIKDLPSDIFTNKKYSGIYTKENVVMNYDVLIEKIK